MSPQRPAAHGTTAAPWRRLVLQRVATAALGGFLAALPFATRGAAAPASPPAAGPDFRRDIQPVLERSCLGCHGPEKQKSGYRLDRREPAIRGGDSGKPAIVPHNPDASPLIRFVSGADPEMRMPPKESRTPPLSATEIQLLRDWIQAGPSWPEAGTNATNASGASRPTEPPHWSLQPLRRPPVPAPAGSRPPRAGANPIDAFIQARLRERGLLPSPEADRRTLLRRVTADLTGLPPTPEEMDAFLADPDPRAYERRVDQLLASPRHGERWARHWLDTIHFADSHGYEHDLGRDSAWRFRDYVIRAFNEDTPWDRFIREQLAADVFYPNEPRLIAALGYLGAGTFDLSTYSTAPVTFDYLDRDDLVTQTMAAFVSTTANCARCHAHKFDPISQEDYYSLQAVFAGILKGERAYDEDPAVHARRRQWTALQAAVQRRDAAVLLAEEHAPAVRDWVDTQGTPVQWATLRPETFTSTDGATLGLQPDGSVLSTGAKPERDNYSITAPPPGAVRKVTAIRLEVLAHDSLPMRGPGRNENGNLHLSEFQVQVFRPGATSAIPVRFSGATADFNQAGWDIGKALDGNLTTAWGIHPNVGQSHQAVFALAEPLELAPADRLVVLLRQLHGGGHLIGSFRLAVTGDDPGRAAARPAEVDQALAIPADRRSLTQQVAIAAHALGPLAARALAQLPAPSVVFAAGPSVDIVSGDPPRQAKSLAEPKTVHVLHRGDFDKPRDVAAPGALSALTHLPSRFALKNARDEGSRRAALADWLAHPGNVLTWRSVVNRVWHHHFGRGLCDTPGDFGRMGGVPSHPELMDWLAVWFRDEARGSLRQLHRLIVTSQTYRQSSAHRDEPARVDAENRLLWRQARTRLDADAYRDFTLAVAGTLDLREGGPAIQQFKQSKGPQITPALDYTAYDWSQPGAGRRSIYRYVWRGIPDPFMDALDFPDLGLLVPVRGFSASSLQALTLFNNDFVQHHAGAFARRLAPEADGIEAQVERAVRLAWLRRPAPAELEALARLARAQGLPALCRVLLNSNEFLFLD